ncbi:substrate-binding domain-containing protein [Pseudoalteromonas sp. SSM20]|uniref:substrate-binding domain-containing protein n=1 Tax=Pseudoalteromonas sp. SSM20 TaxID=3139394 RepID=UPI003BAC3D9F
MWNKTSYLTFITSFLFNALLLLLSSTTYANYTIGVIGKTKNDSFYIQSFKGCEAVAKSVPDLRCIYDGADDFQDIRGQVLKVNRLIDNGVNALLISTTDSEFLVNGALKRAYDRNIPVITFDSDLLPQHHDYRMAYVGTNNFDFGVALGQYIKDHVKNKNTVCMQSGHPSTPNLNERIKGVRHALSGQSIQPLKGQQGWYEHELCPLYSLGKRGLALSQMVGKLKLEPSPIFVAVAGFAQFNPRYIEQMALFKNKIKKDQVVIVSADTEAIQLKALEKGLSTVNIGQKPFDMGKKGAEYLYQFLQSKEKPKQEFTYLGFHYCDKNNAQTCTVNY